LTLDPAREFFNNLAKAVNEQSDIIDRVFPPTINVMLPFLERVCEDVISEYVTPLIDESHDRDIESYLKTITELYVDMVQFGKKIRPAKGSTGTFSEDMVALIIKVFEPHVDLYLTEEIEHFKQLCEDEVGTWEKKVCHLKDSIHGAKTDQWIDKRRICSSRVFLYESH
jgi:recyclin-1